MSDEADKLEAQEDLRGQLAAATSAAQNAYRDTTRLVRLLMAIGKPESPDKIVREALATLSDVFSADVTCVANPVGTRLFVSTACGLPFGADGFVAGWPLDEAAAEALGAGASVSREQADGSGALPADLQRLGIKSRAWVPLTTGIEKRGLLILCRSSGEPFTDPDMRMLDSVAYRLCMSIEAAQRLVARERLARLSQRLARHLDMRTLLVEVPDLFRSLTAADTAAVVTIVGDKPVLRQSSASAPPVPGWPDRADQMAGWASAIAGISFVRDDVTLDEQAGFVFPTPSRAFLSVPVMREGRVAALLNSGRHGPVPFDADTVEVAEIFANQVGAAMANASLYHALATNIARLSLIADSITELVAVLDRNAMIQHASPPLAAAIGMNPEDLVGKNAVDLCHDEDKVRLLASVRDPRAEPTVRFRLRARFGDWVPLECRRSAGATPAGEVVLIGRIVGPSD